MLNGKKRPSVQVYIAKKLIYLVYRLLKLKPNVKTCVTLMTIVVQFSLVLILCAHFMGYVTVNQIRTV